MTRRERIEQKHRTREAILAGARELVGEGKPVTVTAAAARMGVSKATAYRYFKDPAVLTAEAGLAVRVQPYEEVVAAAATLRDKLLAINLYFFDLALDNEGAFRRFLARSLEASLVERPATLRRRGARRIAMYERALRAEGKDIDEPRVTRFVAALGTATGSEAMIALLDVIGMDRVEARVVVQDMTLALIDRFEHSATDADS